MPTSFSFTSAQLAQINTLRSALVNSPKSQPSGAVPLYSYIFKCITGIDLSDSSYLNNTQAVFDTLNQRVAQGVVNDDVKSSAVWLYGAIQVNSHNGLFSKVICGYNIRQGPTVQEIGNDDLLGVRNAPYPGKPNLDKAIYWQDMLRSNQAY